VFHTLQIDRDDYALDQFVALNDIGEAGLRDKVDQHYWSTFGAASMIGLLTGLSQLATTGGLTGGDGDRTIVIAGATGDAASQATAQTLDRFLRRPPRITVTEGHRFHVYVSRDLNLPVYSPESVVPSGQPTP
jgi:type IV secretion system protein TrbI